MVVGLLRVRLHLPGARSLKDRRAIVRKALDRIRARFNVSAAEVGDLERWQVATLGFSVISNDRAHANEVLDKVSAALASAVAGEASILDRQLELISYGDDEPLVERDSLVPLEARLPDVDPDEED